MELQGTYDERREAERLAEQKHYQDREDLIRQIYAALPPGVASGLKTFDPAEWTNRHTDINLTDGGSMSIDSVHSGSGRGTKIRIHAGEWPSYKDQRGNRQIVSPYNVGEVAPGIEVSIDRGPAIIAKEIVRRFLPLYRDVYSKCLARCEATTTANATAKRNHEVLSAAFGVPVKESQHSEELRISWNPKESSAYAYNDIRVTEYGVSMDLRALPLALACRIAEILKEVK